MEQALIGESSSSPRNAANNSNGGPNSEPAPRWLVVCIQHMVDRRLLWAFLRYVALAEFSRWYRRTDGLARSN